jgi:DNA polymerase-1
MGYIRTALGRQIWINPYNYQWKNNSINGPIQGTAAEMTKLAVVNLYDLCQLERLQFPVCLIVHDEIVLDIPKEMKGKYIDLLDEAWMNAGKITMPGMPIRYDTRTGKNWGKGEDDD